MNYLDEVEKMLRALKQDYENTKRENEIMMRALEFIDDNQPGTPNEYAVIRGVARKAINECD